MIKKIQTPLIVIILALLTFGFSAKSYAASCNWKNRNPYMFAWDSCKNNSSANVNGYISFQYNTSCFKYSWTVNGVAAGNNYVMHKNISQNGTYNICVKVTDTCNNCDTTFCTTKTINCFSNSCNWKNRNPYLFAWDSCKNNSTANVNGYISFQYNTSCFKYSWTVNGVAAGNNYVMHKNISQNGTYNICVKVTDTCNKCDTTFCTTKTISCFGNKCVWKNKIAAINFFDSCNGIRYRNSTTGYVAMNQNSNTSCLKLTWKIDNQVVANTYFFHAPILSNGFHSYCVKITDTCNNCDTVICQTRYYYCKNLGIEDHLMNQKVSIYPMPAIDHLNIHSDIETNNVTISNISGQLIWQGAINIGDTLLDVAMWPSGWYVLTFSTQEGKFFRKIQIE